MGKKSKNSDASPIRSEVVGRESHAEAEEKYRILFDSIDEGFCVVEVLFDESGCKAFDYRFLEVNPTFEKQTGLSNAAGRTARELVPDLEEKWFEIYGNIALTGEPIRFVNGSDTMSRWFDVYAFRVGGETSHKVAMLFNDISERKQAEENLKHQKNLLEALTESVLDGILIVSPEGRMLHFNQRFLDIWNFPAEVVESQSDERALEWAAGQTMNPAAFLERVTTVYEQPDREVREELPMKDGRVYERFGAPIRGDNPRLGWAWTFRDITERKRAETNLAFLAEISQDLARLTSVDEMMQTVGAKIGAYLNLSNCAFAEINEAADEVVINYDWHQANVPSLVGVYRISELVTDEFHKTIRAGEIFVVCDTQTDTRTDAEQYAALQIGSFFSVPLVRNGEWRFLLAVYHQEAHDWRADEIELVRELTTRIWTRLERARAEENLRESEERYRILAETASDAFITIDENSTIQYVNTAAERIFGYAAKEMIGQSLTMLMPEELREQHRAGFGRYLKTGKRNLNWESIEVPARHKEGRHFPLEISFGEYNRDDKRFFIGIARDITERKAAEQALHESEGKFRNLANSMSQFAWMTDASGFIFWYNDRWFEYTGTTLEEMQGWGWQAVHHPEEVERVTEKFKQHIALGEVWEDTFPLRSKTGEYRWFLSRALPIRNENGKVVRWFGTNTDIEEVRQARLQAEQANLLKDEFLATVSHELRTPLNAILGWSTILKTSEMSGEMPARAVETIYRNAKSQAQLIEDLLDVSRIITEKMRIEPHPVGLASVIEAAIETFRPAIEEKSIELESNFDCEPCMINGDEQRLLQIVWNLISNAVKFTPDGGKIAVKLENDNLHARLTVSDTGKGIEAEFLPVMFERFRQEDASSTRRHGGLGLGLAIVRHLVKLHGGTISVKSAGANLGSTFTLELPLIFDSVRQTNQAIENAENTRESLSGGFSGENQTPKQLTNLRVLLVDDEPDTLKMLDMALSYQGADVRAASSAADAFEILQSWQPDVLVSDIAMPDEDGYSLIARIRGLTPAKGGSVPAIAMTAYVRVEDRMRVLSAGFQMYIPKPAEPAELITAIINLSEEKNP